MSDHPEHPLAAKLYRDFRAGSKIMTKDEAWRIANELDAQLAEIIELRSAGAKLAREVKASVESLR